VLLEEGLQLGEGHLDRVEVGAVGRQEAQFGAGPLDGVAHGGGLVGGQVVHDDDVAGPERRHQDLLDVSQEGAAMHGTIEHHGCRHAAGSQGADEGGGLPVAVRHRRPATLATPGASATASHLGRRPRLIDEHQAIGIQFRLEFEPSLPPPQDVRTLLLAGVRGFF